MNRKGELSNRVATIVAIDYDTIFSKKPSLKDFLRKVSYNAPLSRNIGI